jgi:hypothetical protein
MSNERRRFRAWAKKQRLDLDRDRVTFGEYMWSDTQLAWDAWQARAELEKHPTRAPSPKAQEAE